MVSDDADNFSVNLRDPADVRRGFQSAIARVVSISDELRLMEPLVRERDAWQQIADSLANILPDEVRRDVLIGDDAADAPGPDERPAGTLADAGHDGDPSQPQDFELVSEVVNREPRAIKAIEVRAILESEGHSLTPAKVSNALHYAAVRAHRIRKAEGRGMYAPLNFPPPTDERPRETLDNGQDIFA